MELNGSEDEQAETRALERLVTELLGEIEYLRTEVDMTRARLEQAQVAVDESRSGGGAPR